jgi:hypothetical protein
MSTTFDAADADRSVGIERNLRWPKALPAVALQSGNSDNSIDRLHRSWANFAAEHQRKLRTQAGVKA